MDLKPEPIPMVELFGHNPALLVPITMFLGATLVGIVAVGGAHWRKVRQAELDAALKHRMIDQGMPADDIVKVLRGSGDASSKEEPVRRGSCCR